MYAQNKTDINPVEKMIQRISETNATKRREILEMTKSKTKTWTRT